jgi:hypothetical protein
MSTTSAINPGLASLLQTLSNVGSPLLSSPQAVAALQKASPADIVQLSAEATQLESLNALLGVPNTNSPGTILSGATLPGATATDPFASLEAAVAAATARGSTASSSSSSSTPSLADAIASYERTAQSGEIASLFGTGTSAGSTTGSTVFG